MTPEEPLARRGKPLWGSVPAWIGSLLVHLALVVFISRTGFIAVPKTQIFQVKLLTLPAPAKDPVPAVAPRAVSAESKSQLLPAETTRSKPQARKTMKAAVPNKVTRTTSVPAPEVIPRVEPPPVVAPPQPETRLTERLPHAELPIRPAALEEISTLGAATAPTLPDRPSDPPAPEELQTRYVGANFTAIRDRVRGKLRYPTIAQRQRWTGQVRVKFRILPTGEIEDLQVLGSSGYPLLDRQALKAIESSTPFPPPEARISIIIPVTFELN